MNTTAASANPMPDGMEVTPRTKIVSGTQNQNVARVAPVTIDAVGTSPSCGLCRRIVSVVGGPATATLSATTMRPTYGPAGLQDTAITRRSRGG
ncbi:hypothetical protein MMUR_21100 [Mycolicibacterium murale]|uniref:Uncharacterized protein n=1 Tax=Mycolicibacterium murale TaxID=182220 RepID=A0A7I9WJW9_9MYCO|nr:hypothetical protein MTOK_01850 [Mycolicibacterium tokaiense]GFG57974.1 hypothetical protein MMUR_21100 [Mycolicibacterium murale]